MARMSNNERLERMAAEKAAAAREREEKAAQKKKTKAKTTKKRASSKSAAASTERMRIVWAVCNHLGDPVKTFPYPEKDKAEAEAARLTKDKGKRHYVESTKVPVE